MKEIRISAAELLSLLADKGNVCEGNVYRVSEKIVFSQEGTYYGNGATFIAEGGIEVCGNNISLCKCKIIANGGIVSTGDAFTLYDCEIIAEKCAVLSKGKRFIAKNNKISSGSVGIELQHGYNGLVAHNAVNSSVIVSDSFNCVVILNSAESVKAESCTNLYVIKNALASSLDLTDNKYLICDGNDANNVTSVGNTEINGDNVTDINARLEFGANEELLPHTNDEQFIGMDRYSTVSDCSNELKLDLASYICKMSSENAVVIVPPGAYKVEKRFIIGEEQKNTDIYAYGVYAEAEKHGQIVGFYHTENVNISGITFGYAEASSGQLHIVKLLGDKKAVGVVAAGYGEEYGNSDLSKYRTTHESLRRSYQDYDYDRLYGAYLIEKNSDGSFVLTFKDDHYENLEVGDILLCRMAGDNSQSVHVTDSVSIHFKDLTMHGYAQASHCRNERCENVTYERYIATPHAPFIIDQVTYEKYKAWEKEYGVDLEVYIDTCGRYRGTRPRLGGTGTMEVADAKGGVNLTSCKMFCGYDDGSNQRGTSSRLAFPPKDNGDGTYTVYFKGCLSQIYHSLNTNKAVPFGVGATAMPKKGDILFAYGSDGEVLFNGAVAVEDALPLKNSSLHLAHEDKDGDGICDICGKPAHVNYGKPAKNAKYDSESGKISYDINLYITEIPLTYTTTVYSVKIKTDSMNMKMLDKYDLLANEYYSATQLFFDNVSRNCYGFTYDNVLVHNPKARGSLIKTQDVTVKNCTFKGTHLEGLIIGKETAWGESTVPRNVTIQNCIFDNTVNSTKKFFKEDHFAPINIQGLGEVSKSISLDNGFACSNILIKHNKFINNTRNYIIYATGAQNISITENIFEEADGGKIMYVNGCINVDLSGNMYSEKMSAAVDQKDIDMLMTAYKYKSVCVEGIKLSDSDESPDAE